MRTEYTIVHGIECASCGKPIVVITEQYNPGEVPFVYFNCVDKCCGFMKQQVYPQTIRMKEKK